MFLNFSNNVTSHAHTERRKREGAAERKGGRGRIKERERGERVFINLTSKPCALSTREKKKTLLTDFKKINKIHVIIRFFTETFSISSLINKVYI